MKALSNKCPSCGKQHVAGFAFCQRCGSPLKAPQGGNPVVSRPRSDTDEDEALDLNGRILNLLERGRNQEAIRLYHEVLGGDIKVAEAAIDELAKNIEFTEVQHAVSPPAPAGNKQTGWFGNWIEAIRALLGFNRG